MRQITLEEWRNKAIELFGHNPMKWRFRCPACGNVQTPGDFFPYRNQGATPDSAFQACIGRFDGHMSTPMGESRPCNYAGFGLFKLQKTEVLHENGEYLPVFEFDDGGE